MPDNFTQAIIESAQDAQSTHNKVTSNAAAMLAIRLASRYLLQKADTEALAQPASSTTAASSSSAASSSVVVPTSEMTIEMTGNSKAQERMSRVRKRYEGRVKLSFLEAPTKAWLAATLGSRTLSKELDRVTLVEEQNGQPVSTEWYLPLPEVYAVVLSALIDLDEKRWPVPPRSTAKKERLLRLQEFDHINNALAKTTPRICPTGIRHAWLMALDGYEGKRLPLNAEDVLMQGLFDFMVREVLGKQMNISLPDGRDPVGEERATFNEHFQSLFLPWAYGTMPDIVVNAIKNAGGSDAARDFVLARFRTIGIAPDELMMQKINGYCSKTGLQSIPCNFIPILAALERHAKRQALALSSGSITATGLRPLAEDTLAWLQRVNLSSEALANAAHEKDPLSILYLVLRLHDTLYQYKDYKNLLDVCDMPEDNKNAWVNALHFHRQCLHNHDLSLTPLLDDTVMLEERLRAFERGFAMWRNGAYHDFISNYAANWFAASDNDRITDCASLFARLCDLYFRENTEGSNSIPAIRVPDAMLDEWIAKAGEDGILEVTPYQINRVLLHALCYPADTWSTLFQQCLPILLAFIRNRCNQKQNTAGDALSRDSWPEALLAQIECVAVAYSIGEILDPVLLTPGTITPESSLDIARLLAVSKDMPEAIVRKIVELPGFDPNATNRNRLTPFYLAAEYGNTGFAAALMGRGANYKVRYLWDNVTPLQVAIKNQHLPFLQWFLQALPEHERELLVAAIDYNGTTLLNHAAHNSASLKIILDCLPEAAREDIVMRTKFQGDTMLHEVARNNPKFLKDLLNYLPEAARTNAVKLKGIRDITILHLIAGTHLELLKEILDCLPEADRAGAVRECYSLCGSTLLHFAASKSTEILKQLLDFLPKSDRAKAVMNQNKNGNTVVHLAVGYPESLKQLLNFLPGTAVADTVKLKNIYEKNVLDLAVAYPESLEWLLNSLPETVVEDAMRAQNTNGNTVLCRAVAHLESLKLLLNYLPKKKVEDAVLAQYDYGKTVLHQAVAYPESFQLLLDYLPKATVAEAMKLKNRDGNTVLHLAARDPELLKMLLNYRPKATVAEVMTLKNLDGHTVLHVAAINSPDVLIQLLDYLPETVRAGAIVAQINGGYNLLHLVAEKRPDVLIQLLDYLPDPARASAIVAQNRIGETVLHLVSGYPESLRYLKAILEQAAQQKATQSDVGPIIPNQDAGAAQSSIASSSETGTSTLLGSHSLFSQGSVRPQDPDSPGEQSTLKR